MRIVGNRKTLTGGISEKWSQSNFGNLDSNGSCFGMGDASVQMISFVVDSRVHYQLANRHDGQNVQILNQSFSIHGK